MQIRLGLGSWAYWSAVARNPVALTGVLVDLLPIWAVLVWGWDAAALVMLYWLENLVIGVLTVFRVTAASIGQHRWWGLVGGLWTSALFTVHYGLFCFGHGGILLEVFGKWGELGRTDAVSDMLPRMIEAALSFGPHMTLVVGAIVVWQAFAFVRDFLLGGEWLSANPPAIAFGPYGRVILLHIGVFVVAGALEYLGDPGVGALALVIARAAWGLRINMKREPQDDNVPDAVAA